MVRTGYEEVDTVLADILAGLQGILGDGLLGLYMYGSLITGDFDESVSDIDLLAILDHDVSEAEYSAIERMHERLAQQHPRWDGRIEVQYWGLETIQRFLDEPRELVVISPGEPYHRKEADHEYQLNLWITREQSRTVYGPSPSAYIDEIPPTVYEAILHDHIDYYVDHIRDETGERWQSYVRLTMCRALYSLRFGVQASKQRSAAWVVEQWPEWDALVEDALAWRRSKDVAEVDASRAWKTRCAS